MIRFTYSSEPVLITSGEARLAGVLELPASPAGVVLFIEDSGSHHLSPRSNYLAEKLRNAGLATLLLDLLGLGEESDGRHRSDIALMGARLVSAADWLAMEPETKQLPLGLYGSGKDAAAALQLAACRPERIAAVVARGGRPDLAGAEALARVRAPTLLIVAEEDHAAIERNRLALGRLSCEKDLAVIRGASRPEEDRRMPREIARLAERWFKGYIGGDSHPAFRPPLR